MANRATVMVKGVPTVRTVSSLPRPDSAKPHLRKLGMWQCVTGCGYGAYYGHGHTPESAYMEWCKTWPGAQRPPHTPNDRREVGSGGGL